MLNIVQTCQLCGEDYHPSDEHKCPPKSKAKPKADVVKSAAQSVASALDEIGELSEAQDRAEPVVSHEPLKGIRQRDHDERQLTTSALVPPEISGPAVEAARKAIEKDITDGNVLFKSKGPSSPKSEYERTKAWREANPEKHRKWMREYMRKYRADKAAKAKP